VKRKNKAPVCKSATDALEPRLIEEIRGLRGGPKRKRTPTSEARRPRDLTGKKGDWMQSGRETWQVIDVDREANTIRETVTDRRTGQVLLHKIGPLDKHTSRGSAKRRK